MEVRFVLDEEDGVLVRYYADLMGKSVEDAYKDALMDKIRELYESRATGTKQKCTYDCEHEESDDMFSDEDR